MDRFFIPKIPRVEVSCDVEEEEEMQGVSESDLEEEERRSQRDQPYATPLLRVLAMLHLVCWLARILLFQHSFVCIFACSLRVLLYNDTMI